MTGRACGCIDLEEVCLACAVGSEVACTIAGEAVGVVVSTCEADVATGGAGGCGDVIVARVTRAIGSVEGATGVDGTGNACCSIDLTGSTGVTTTDTIVSS
jgi:hypothetical protein